MAPLPTLRRKRKKRARQRARQYAKYKATGKRGHLKAFRRHKRAVRYLRRLITRAVKRDQYETEFASPNFRYAEFNCKDGRVVPLAAHNGLDHLCKNYLEPLRKKFGAIYVTSGYRPLDYNRRIGGASMSVHIYDYSGRDGKAVAADVICRTGTPAQWGAFLKGLGADGIGIYNASGFVHCDNRTRMGWPKSTGFGN